MDSYPIYVPYGGQTDTPRSAASVASGLSQRTIPDTLTRDKIYRWITFRMKFNKDLLTEMFSDKGAHSLHEYDSRQAMSRLLRDPDAKRLGIMLKKKYCGTDVGLHENSYFVFGLPRVRRINDDMYRNLEGHMESFSIDVKTSQEKNSSAKENEMEIVGDESPSPWDQDPEPIYRKSTKGPNKDLKESRGAKKEKTSEMRPAGSKRDDFTSADNIYGQYIRNPNSDGSKPDLKKSQGPRQENTSEIRRVRSKRDDFTSANNIYSDYIRNPTFDEPKPLRSRKGPEMQWLEYETPINKVDPSPIYGRTIVPENFYFQGI